GMYAYSGVLTALFARATSGAVRPVEVSLFEALAEWVGQPAYYTRFGGIQPPRVGTQHATIAPYGAYTCADGKDVLLAVQSEHEWDALCTRFLAAPGLVDDPRFATVPARVTHREELNAVLARRFARTDSAEAMRLLDEAAIAHASVNTVADFLAHP